MPLPDLLGLIGVVLILIAYAGAALKRLDPAAPTALLLNLVGAVLILYSLSFAFNLSAVIMEAAWALVAVIGLVRYALARKDQARRRR